MVYYVNINPNKVEVAILISDKVDLKQKYIIRNKGGHFIIK